MFKKTYCSFKMSITFMKEKWGELLRKIKRGSKKSSVFPMFVFTSYIIADRFMRVLGWMSTFLVNFRSHSNQ